MQRTVTLAPQWAVSSASTRWVAWLRQVWGELWLDADQRFLREASDLADLERRMRSLERGRPERFAPLGTDA
jgi:hypothetical protein